jgi:hypothetical protein
VRFRIIFFNGLAITYLACQSGSEDVRTSQAAKSKCAAFSAARMTIVFGERNEANRYANLPTQNYLKGQQTADMATGAGLK